MEKEELPKKTPLEVSYWFANLFSENQSYQQRLLEVNIATVVLIAALWAYFGDRMRLCQAILLTLLVSEQEQSTKGRLQNAKDVLAGTVSYLRAKVALEGAFASPSGSDDPAQPSS